MTNEELNKFLHEQVMGKCWHTHPDVFYSEDNHAYCCEESEQRLDQRPLYAELPDYCSDLNAVAEVEAKVIEKAGANEYAWQLSTVACPGLAEVAEQSACPYTYHGEWNYAAVITATAEQRARACYEAVKMYRREK